MGSDNVPFSDYHSGENHTRFSGGYQSNSQVECASGRAPTGAYDALEDRLGVHSLLLGGAPSVTQRTMDAVESI